MNAQEKPDGQNHPNSSTRGTSVRDGEPRIELLLPGLAAVCLLAALFRSPFVAGPPGLWMIAGALAGIALPFLLSRQGGVFTAPWPEERWAAPAAAQRWVWLAAMVVAILAMWPRSALLEQSLTDPEVRELKAVKAYHANAASGVNSIPSLGPVQVELAGAMTGQPVADAAPSCHPPPNERVQRTPAWVAGIVSTILTVLLGAAMGSPRAGLAAGLILAMHPEHARWSATIGGSATGLLCLTAVLLCLLSWLRNGRLGWWVALAAAEAGALLSGHAELLPVNAATALLLWLGPGTRQERTARLLHLAAALTVALGVLIFCPFGPGPETGRFESLADTVARWFAGVPWRIGEMEDAAASLTGLAEGAAWRGLLLYGLLPVSIAAGIYFMVRQDWRTRLVSLSLLAALLLPSGAALAAEHREAPALLLMALAPAWAGAGLIRRFPQNRRLLFAPLVAAVLYVMATSAVLQRLMRVPRQPVEQVTKAARGTAEGANVITATFGREADTARVYDNCALLENLPALNALVDESLKTERTLMIYYRTADGDTPELKRMQEEIERSGRFVPVRQYAAFDPRDSYRLYRYQLREQIIRLNLDPGK